MYSGTCESCHIRSCMMYMSPGEEQHTPNSSISEDTPPNLSVGEQH